MQWIRKSTKKISRQFFGSLEQLENKIALSTTPNDPLFINQWAINSISANRAWDATTGSKEIVVGVIDSGVDTNHVDLKNNIWTNPGEIAGNNLDDDNNGFIDDIHGWNFYDNSSNIQDTYGHGTHIAGIIGAEGNNAVGVAGINWRVSIMVLKFTDANGMGYTGAAASAVDYASMMKSKYNINVVALNASWGGLTGLSQMLQTAVSKANENNILFVAAAGNSGADCDIIPRYPACLNLPNVISVAAIDRYNNMPAFSNYGANSIDLAAPGVGVYSTRPNNNYAGMSGTSQAAPQVTGAIALIFSVKPNLSISEVKDILMSSVDKLPNLTSKVISGGKLNLASALIKAGVILPPEIKEVVATLPVIVEPEKILGGIGLANINRIRGWAYSSYAKDQPISVRLIINNNFIREYTSNIFRPSLNPYLGSSYHGFTILMNRRWLKLGNNTVTIEAINRSTNQTFILGTRNIRRFR